MEIITTPQSKGSIYVVCNHFHIVNGSQPPEHLGLAGISVMLYQSINMAAHGWNNDQIFLSTGYL